MFEKVIELLNDIFKKVKLMFGIAFVMKAVGGDPAIRTGIARYARLLALDFNCLSRIKGALEFFISMFFSPAVHASIKK